MEMDAATYDLVVRLVGSAIAGLILFLVGLFIGWIAWKDTKYRAADIKREDNTRADNLSEVVREP